MTAQNEPPATRRHAYTRRLQPLPSQLLSRILKLTLVGFFGLLIFVLIVLPRVRGGATYTVLTGSMAPAIHPGDLVATQSVNFEDIKVGDIVVYQLESGQPTTVTHRVTAFTWTAAGTKTLTTRGDANNVTDSLPVRAEQIHGKVMYVVPKIGYLTNLGTARVRSLLLLVTAFGLITYGILTLAAKRTHNTLSSHALVALVFVVPLTLNASGGPAHATTPPVEPIALSLDEQNWMRSGNIQPTGHRLLLVPNHPVRLNLTARNLVDKPVYLELSATAQLADSSPIETTHPNLRLKTAVHSSTLELENHTNSNVITIEALQQHRFILTIELNDQSASHARSTKGIPLMVEITAVTTHLPTVVNYPPAGPSHVAVTGLSEPYLAAVLVPILLGLGMFLRGRGRKTRTEA
ncbi:signal peptidase I [Populibacterium corticicola]|uniref:Signal peptidase I n=1 Tax=Populibacterium corticicola TaxID=1812826 RepID=A0ABW5XFM5_9MICO